MSTIFCRNLHPIDRGIRIALGIGLVGAAFVVPGALWGAIGVVPVATGITGGCPVYGLLGIRRCQTR